MKKLLIALSIVMFAAASAAAQAADAAPAASPAPSASPAAAPAAVPAPSSTATAAAAESRVFALNLSAASIDLKLGTDGVFSTTGLALNMASQMVVFKNFAARSILYKSSTSELWQETKQADGKTLAYQIQGGKTYLILVQSNGVPGLYELAASSDTKPKIAVANTTDRNLATIQVGSGYGLGTVASAADFGPGWSNFADVAPGTYGAFWSYATMPAGVGYFYTSGKDGKSLGVTPFVDGGWYFAVVWHDSAKDQSGGIIWDISPKK